MTHGEIAELSAEGMAASRIMKGLGLSAANIGMMCRRFGIPYDEEASTFQRAVKILREVYPEKTALIPVIDVRSGKDPEEFYDEFLDIPQNAMIFFRIEYGAGHAASMTTLISGMHLNTSPLGQIVIQPGIRYVASRDGMQLWEQSPVELVKSFSRNNKED